MAKKSYGNESITALKGADRVRKRPGVIFGSDGLEGCEHSVFEIVSNSIEHLAFGLLGVQLQAIHQALQVGSLFRNGHGSPLTSHGPDTHRYGYRSGCGHPR